MNWFNSILVLLIASSIITDVKSRKIYNIQTFTAMACGLVLHFSFEGINGLLFSLYGLILGLLLLIFFFLNGSIGAGDVKLLAAIGALKGTVFTLETMFFAALIGGFMAVIFVIKQKRFTQTLKNTFHFICHPIKYAHNDSTIHQYLPYGVAISTGCACTLFKPLYVNLIQ